MGLDAQVRGDLHRSLQRAADVRSPSLCVSLYESACLLAYRDA